MRSAMPDDQELAIFEAFLSSAPEEAAVLMKALAVAESLTDQLAEEIYKSYPIPGVSFDLFLRSLRSSGLVTPRNSEWHLPPAVRSKLYKSASIEKDLFYKINCLILETASNALPNQYGVSVPRYLGTGAGIAYHKVSIDSDKNLRLYTSGTSHSNSYGELWLAVELSSLQVSAGLINRDAIEPSFLRGMLLYRDGKRQDALIPLQLVASSNQQRSEVSIACHLSGLITSRQKPNVAIRLLKKGLRLSSLIGDTSGQAKIAHTLANVVASREPAYALELLRLSIELDTNSGNIKGEAQSRLSLSRLLQSLKMDGAEEELRKSLILDEKIDNFMGVAKSLHSLGNMVRSRNLRDAEILIRRSLKIGLEEDDKRHVAQVSRSLGRVVQSYSPVEAERLYRMSIRVNTDLKDWDGVRLATTSLEKLSRNVKIKSKR